MPPARALEQCHQPFNKGSLPYNGSMFARLKNIVIWQYDPATSDTTLRRHDRVARIVVGIWTTSSVVMISSMVDFLLRSGTSTVAFVLVIASTAISLGFTLPAIAALSWATEIEKVAASRGLAQFHRLSAVNRVALRR